MDRITFFSVLGSNLKCAFCKNKHCRVRYYPQRKKIQILDGRKFADICQKDREKRAKNAFKRKLVNVNFGHKKRDDKSNN